MLIVKREFRHLTDLSEFRKSLPKKRLRSVVGEIEDWLRMQNIQAKCSSVLTDEDAYGFQLRFLSPKHQTIFLLKYSEYVYTGIWTGMFTKAND